ncbi:MAG: cytidine deaminase [Rhodobacteraceae bacterium]|nr:cytidine deaminase [Paracoccaceae bacterium]
MSLEKSAFAVRENAYAPYSNFKVGAAVLSEGGTVYAGCNVENIAYPEGTCAEAGAIAAMVAAGETKLTEVFVVADSKQPVSPCGGCRQKLAEFGDKDTVVTLANLDGVRLTMTMAELLPGAFGSDHMDADHQDRD